MRMDKSVSLLKLVGYLKNNNFWLIFSNLTQKREFATPRG